MSWIDRIGAALAVLTAKNSTLDLFKEIYGSRATKSGQAVTWQTALQVSTVFRTATVIAYGLASMPFKPFQKRAGGGREPAENHPIYNVVTLRPNAWQTRFDYLVQVILHLVLCGNHFSFKNYVGVGAARKLVELIPFEPGTVRVIRNKDYSRTYEVRGDDGAVQTFRDDQIWHLKGPAWLGWFGLEPVRLAREAIGLALAIEEQQANLQKEGLNPSGVYAVEGDLKDDQYKKLRAWIVSHAMGGVNSGAPLILDRSAKWQQLTMTSVDAETLNTRRFMIEEICRFAGVLPIMVGHADKTQTYASAEQMFLAHVTHCLTPWAVNIELSAAVNLLTPEEIESGLYFKFMLQGLLRGDSTARANYFAKALGAGGSPAWMTQDEVRELDELNPMGGKAAELAAPTSPAVPDDKPPKKKPNGKDDDEDEGEDAPAA